VTQDGRTRKESVFTSDARKRREVTTNEEEDEEEEPAERLGDG
jgi:hypothetical protein